MRRLSRVLFALVVLAAAGSLTVGPAVGRAPPQPVCGVCTSGLDQAAAAHGVDVERAASTMTVDGYANGSSRWTARVHLTKGADALGANATRRREIVDGARHSMPGGPILSDPVNLRSRVDGDTLVVTYLARHTAHTTLGVLRFDAFDASDPPFFAAGGEGTPYPGADTLVVRAPDGYDIRGHGDTDTANQTAVTWRGDSHEQYAGDMDRHTVVSSTKRDSLLPGVRTRLASIVDWF